MDDTRVKEMVRVRYGGIATAPEARCYASAASGCCSPELADTSHDKARQMGYSEADLAAVPEGVNLGLGSGNPLAIAALQLGETVVDLGSGAGFDCFLGAAGWHDRSCHRRRHDL
jgi:arsenite methyltransferase